MKYVFIKTFMQIKRDLSGLIRQKSHPSFFILHSSFFILSFLPLSVSAQQVEWNVDALGFFDNSEGDHTLRRTQTYAGLGVSPEVGLSWNNRQHAIMGGANLITSWGANEDALKARALVYYQYQSPKFRFLMGSFMRDKLLGDYPEYLLSDTIRYYRPVVQGMAWQYVTDNGHFEAFLDWTSAISKKDREQFMAGISTKWQFQHFLLGAEGYYYHYALHHGSTDDEHIHDYLIAHPFIGIGYERLSFLDALELKGGLLAAFDRERGIERGSHTPIGFLGELSATWKRLQLKQTIYAGGNMQHFGNAHLGQYYWGDTYTQAPFYSRTDLRYRFISNNFVNVYAGVIVNATRYGINHHQVITLRLNLGSKNFKPISLK